MHAPVAPLLNIFRSKDRNVVLSPYVFPSGGGFVPTDIPNIHWWEAANYSAVTGTNTDTGNVTPVSLTQTTIGSRPSVITGLNGLPGRRFDGVDDVLLGALTPAQPFSICAVITLSGDGRWMDSNSISNNRALADINFLGALLIYASNVVSGSSWTGSHCGIWSFDGASSFVYVDGAATLSGNAGTSGIVGGMTLGGFIGIPPGEFAAIDLYDVVLGESGFTAPEIANLSSYFATKYAL